MKNYKFKMKDLKKKDKELRKIFKKCKKCENLKSTNDFEKHKTKDGLRNECKECINNRYLLECEYCNKSFGSRTKGRKFCSLECSHNYKKGENHPRYGEKHSEETKNKISQANKGKEGNRKNSIYYNCDYCGKESVSPKCHYDRAKNHFCSRECQGKWLTDNNIGKNNPNWKDKIKYECDQCGETILLTDYKLNISENHFCSRDCMGKWLSKNKSGENSWNWNHNISEEERYIRDNLKRCDNEYLTFKKSVYERDNYTCQCCGQVGGKLNAHHIYGYAEYKELRTDVDNGILLCEECHKSYHKQYGIKNNNWRDFRTFLFNKWKETNNLQFVYIIEDIDLRLQQKELESA